MGAKKTSNPDTWDVVYFKLNNGSAPALDFLDECPTKVEAEIMATLEAVRYAPPPRFSGGGRWEAMHGQMTGYFEVRTQGPKREQFRLFCLLENSNEMEMNKRGLERPAIAAITGLRKPWMTVFSDSDYAAVRALGNKYKASFPRSIMSD